MDINRFGFEGTSPAADAAAEGDRDGESRAPMRASPDTDGGRGEDDPRAGEPPDEPGYGHGV